MPKGVANKNKNQKSKSRSVKSKNNIQLEQSTRNDKEITSTIIEEKANKISSKKLPDLPINIEPQFYERDTNRVDESDQGEKPSTIDPKSDLNFFIEDVRGSIKESTLIDSSSQVLPGSAYQKKKFLPKFFQTIDNWMYGKVRNPFTSYKHVTGSEKRKRSPIRIIFLIILLVSFGYILVIAGKKLNQITPIAVPIFTPVPTYSIPIPYTVEFPGGWTFLLGTSNSSFPDWKPIRAEWFKDTAICKLIAIPWTKQIDAVYKTLTPGEELILTMSNKDKAIYQIETLETSLIQNLIGKLNRNSPCMIIFLYRESTITAQVLISVPPIP